MFLEAFLKKKNSNPINSIKLKLFELLMFFFVLYAYDIKQFKFSINFNDHNTNFISLVEL